MKIVYKRFFWTVLPMLFMLCVLLFSMGKKRTINEVVPVYVVPCMLFMIIVGVFFLIKSNAVLPEIQKACPTFNIGTTNIKKVKKHLLEVGDLKNANKISELLQIRNMYVCFFLGFVFSFFLLMIMR